jgi:hypothetical protein
MERKYFDLAYIVLIIVVILTCIFLYFFLTSQAPKCLENPLKFQQERMGENFQCSCFSTDPYGAMENKLKIYGNFNKS